MGRLIPNIGTSLNGKMHMMSLSFGTFTDDLHCRIDEEKATKAREEMIRKKVIYGHSVPYRNMCRFNSGVREAHVEVVQRN